MLDKFEILVADKEPLKSIFSATLFLREFKITFCTSERDIISRIDSGLQPDSIVVEHSFAGNNNFELIKQIERKTTLQAALKSDLITKVPLIVILDKEDTDFQIALLDQGVTDVLSAFPQTQEYP